MRKIFIDCGGHVGESILLFKNSKLYDKSFEIFSFEPVPYLAYTYKDWEDITLFRNAVWVYNGTIDFYLSKKLDDGNTLFKGKRTGGIDKENPIRVYCLDFSQWVLWNFAIDDYIILKIRGIKMFNTIIPLNMKMTFRDKARLNICMAKDLAENFGGRKADYLKRLNRRLRTKIYDSFNWQTGNGLTPKTGGNHEIQKTWYFSALLLAGRIGFRLHCN